MKLCECGCGKETKIATRSDSKAGAKKGKPRRFSQGHHLHHFSQEKQIFKFNNRWWIKSRNNKNIPWAHIIYSNIFLAGKEIPKGFEIHHKNRICNDDQPDNLQLLTIAKHRQLHLSKPVVLESQDKKALTFASAVSASRYLNLRDNAVATAICGKYRVKEYIPYYLAEGKPNDFIPQLKKAVVLEKKDGGTKTFESAAEASRWLKLNQSAVSIAIRRKGRVAGWTPSYSEDSK